jgi:hypothetical protein
MTAKSASPDSGRFINIRKLAALDITFHGPRLILAEFGLTAVGLLAFGVYLLRLGLSQDLSRATSSVLFGAYVLLLGLNYVPLLIYAVKIVRGRSAELEVGYELGHREEYVRKHGLQSLLLFVPLAVLGLAIWQGLRREQPLRATA